MAVTGIAALGTAITIDSTPVGGVGDITGPSDSYDWVDTTAHDAPDRTETGVPSVRRTGTVTFTVQVDADDAGQQALLAAHDGIVDDPGTTNSFEITYPDGSTKSFEGYVMEFGGNVAPVTGALTCPCTIRPTGAITTTPASS